MTDTLSMSQAVAYVRDRLDKLQITGAQNARILADADMTLAKLYDVIVQVDEAIKATKKDPGHPGDKEMS